MPHYPTAFLPPPPPLPFCFSVPLPSVLSPHRILGSNVEHYSIPLPHAHLSSSQSVPTRPQVPAIPPYHLYKLSALHHCPTFSFANCHSVSLSHTKLAHGLSVPLFLTASWSDHLAILRSHCSLVQLPSNHLTVPLSLCATVCSIDFMSHCPSANHTTAPLPHYLRCPLTDCPTGDCPTGRTSLHHYTFLQQCLRLTIQPSYCLPELRPPIPPPRCPSAFLI